MKKFIFALSATTILAFSLGFSLSQTTVWKPKPKAANTTRVLVVTGGHDHDADFYSVFDDAMIDAKVNPHPLAFTGDLRKRYEVEYCTYNFEKSDTAMLHKLFETYEAEAKRLLADEQAEPKLILPAYELTLKTSHVFNMLDARGAVSVNERPTYIARVRNLAKKCAQLYLENATV